MRRTNSLLLLGVISCASAFAQNATVTFYSPPLTVAHAVKEEFALYGTVPFFGSVFDGDHKLAALHEGRFVTFELPEGDHVFSATLSSKHPGKHHTLPLALHEGDHYFVRIISNWKSAVVIAIVDPELIAVDCAVAAKENSKSHPVDQKRINKSAQTFISPNTTPFACP